MNHHQAPILRTVGRASCLSIPNPLATGRDVPAAATGRMPVLLYGNSGAALIMTLAVLAVVTLLVVGFAVSMRVEQIASRNYSHSIFARQLADAAIDEAIVLIRTNTPIIDVSRFWLSQPGAMVRRTTSDAIALLYSTNGLANNKINLNYDQSIIGSNSVYATASNRFVEVEWLNICTNGLASGAPLIGRYAFWVDDEGAKNNISAAGTRTNILGTTTRDVALSALPGLSVLTATSSWYYAQTNGFFSTEHWKSAPGVGATTYEQNKFYITAWGGQEAFTPWGARKFHLNASFADWQTEIDGGCANTLNHPGLTNWFGVGNTFTNKYAGLDITKQIAANICDFRWRAGGSALACMGGTYRAAGGANSALGEIPQYYLGLRRYPYLNEIGIQATYWTPAASGACTDPEIQAKIYIIVEVVNPYDQAWGSGGQIRLSLDKLRFRVNDGFAPYSTGPDAGWNLGFHTGPCAAYESAQELTYDITSNIPANSYTNYVIEAYAGQTQAAAASVDELYVRINKIRLLQTANDDSTIRDWASGNDFDQRDSAGACVGYGGNHFCFFAANIQNTAAFPGYNNAATMGLAKNDPRVRRFTTWTPPGSGTQLPWSPVGYDMGNAATTVPGAEENTTVNYTGGTGLANVPNDPTPGVVPALAYHPSFYMKTQNADLTYESSGEMGYIHTGLQWRTVMLQPRPGPETTADLIPDWAVLDIFSVTNIDIVGRMNINPVVTNLYTGNANWRDRIEPLKALIPDNMHTYGFGPNTDVDRIATNIHDLVWASGSTWGTERTTSPNRFISNWFCMIGELCEIDRVSTNYTGATNDALREARIRSFANLVDVRSERFLVHGIGQAIQDVNGDGDYDAGTDLINGEAKIQAVVQRLQAAGTDTVYGTSDDTVTYKVLYFRYLE